MSVSINSIAKKLGISPSTVSRVINGKGNISEQLRKKVLETANEMNYIPNGIAKNLQQKSTKIVGVIVPDITEGFFANVINSIDEVLSEHGYSIFLCNSNENIETEMKYIDLLYESRVAGLIVATVRDEIPPEDKLYLQDIPVVFIDNLPNRGRMYNCVNTDNFAAGELAAQYLISKGHRKIAAIMGKQSESTGRLRYEGFLKGLEVNNITPCPSLYKFCDFKEKSGCAAMKELIEQGGFTAVFIVSSKMVYGALSAIKEKKLSVPSDISILGFDIVDKYNIISPGITSIIQLDEKIGKSAADLIMKKILNKEDKLYHRIYMEPSIIERESVKEIK